MGPGSSYPHLFRILHLLLAPCVPVLFVTGLGLHAASRPGWSRFPRPYPSWLPEGRLPAVHLLAGVLAIAAWGIPAAVYLRYTANRPGGTLRRFANIPLLVGGALSIASAPLLLYPEVAGPLHPAARAVHAVSGMIVVPLGFLLHVFLAVGPRPSRLVAAFDPARGARWLHLLLWSPGLLASACLVLNGLFLRLPGRRLLARRIPANHGVLDGLPWHEAPPLRIALSNGAGFDAGRTRVLLRALHDGRELFLSAAWDDPREDRRYMPWRREPDGWRHLVTHPDDECVHYEDKFSLIFPARPDPAFRALGCAAYCHLGGGRAYGYKASRSTVDVWHWKSVRTDPGGYVDDKYWLGRDLGAEDVGRHGDPARRGGYRKNFEEGGEAPLWLPAGPGAIRHGALLSPRAVPYTPGRAASIPAGTEIPGIAIAPIAGDRGDVSCTSRYARGRWHLILRRRLATGSPHDVAFQPGRAYAFACAAFDRTSKRHAYNHEIYWLVLGR